MSKLLSVIIPVYNAEKTLDRCIESVVSQSYKNIEIILVDDGSTDNSRKLCEQWLKKDDRIHLSKPKINEGLAEARNVGIRMCHGEYLSFVDSDDYLENNAYELMITALERDNSDIVICNFWNIKENSNVKNAAYQMEDSCIETEETIKKIFLEYIPTTAWCKVLKREIMQPGKGENIWFPKGRRYEDTVVSIKQIMNAKKISLISRPLYYYVQSDNTIIAVPKKNDLSDIIKNVEEIQKLFPKEKINNLVACYICSTLTFALQLWYRLSDGEQKERKEILLLIKEFRGKYFFKDALSSNKWKKLIICKLALTDYVVKLKRYIELRGKEKC